MTTSDLWGQRQNLALDLNHALIEGGVGAIYRKLCLGES
jgi:hypothetical protein